MMNTRARFSWRSLTPQLLAVFILPLIALVLALAFGGLYLHQQAMRSMVAERDERSTRAAASALGEQLNRQGSQLQDLLRQAEPTASPQALVALLRSSNSILSDFDGGLAFLSPTGEVLAYSGESSLWEYFDPGEYPQLFASPSDTLTFLSILHPQSKAPLVLAVTPSSASGLRAAGAFSPAALIQRSLGNVFTPGEGATAFVVDGERRLLYKQGDFFPNKDPVNHLGVSEALQGESGASFLQAGGEEHAVAYSPIQPAGWALVIEEPWEKVASPMLRTTEYAPLALIPALLLSLLALWYGTRWIVQPLQQLEAQAAELGWGDFAAIEKPVGGISEIRRLQSELVHLARKVKAAQEGLRGYIGAMTAGQEEERRRLARELHDDTLQSLIALNQRVQLAQINVNGNAAAEDLAKPLAEIQTLTEKTIQDLRRFTRALRPVYLEELGLAAALEMLARENGLSNGLTIDFERAGTEQRLPAAVELALYRIAQEALNNVIRHARANRAILRITFDPQSVILEMSDEGQGFVVPKSPAEFAPGGHFGLLGLHERAESIGARLEIQSVPGQGTRVMVKLGFADNSPKWS